MNTSEPLLNTFGRLCIVFSAGSVVFMLAFAAPGYIAKRQFLEDLPKHAIRGGVQIMAAPQDSERTINNSNDIMNLDRRVSGLEMSAPQQNVSVRMALMESKIDTLFDLGRVVLGAAIVYFVQVAMGAFMWVSSKRKQ